MTRLLAGWSGVRTQAETRRSVVWYKYADVPGQSAVLSPPLGPDDEGSRFCHAARLYILRESDIQSLLWGLQITLSKLLGEANTVRCPHIQSPAVGYSQETRFVHHGQSNIDKAPADPAARGTTTHTEYKNLLWVLSSCFPFWQHIVFWIPVMRSRVNFTNNYGRSTDYPVEEALRPVICAAVWRCSQIFFFFFFVSSLPFCPILWHHVQEDRKFS